MRDWFNRLEPRDANILIFGAIFILAAGLYLSVWEPIAIRNTHLKSEVVEQQKLALWMEQAALQVKNRRRERSTQSGIGNEQSLLTIVDKTSKSSDLGPAIKRIEPEGDDRVRVWLEAASFDVMIKWLVELRQRYRMKAVALNFERTDSPGKVNSRLTLARLK